MRHPLYAGLIALSVGWACLWGSPRGVAVALLQAVLLDAKARREERWSGIGVPKILGPVRQALLQAAEKIKKHQFNLGTLAGKPAAIPDIWAVVLAA